MMNGGIGYVDVTGIGTAGGAAATVVGLYEKLDAAYEAGKILVIYTDGSHADVSASPVVVTAEKGSSSTKPLYLSWVVAGASHIYVYRLSVTNADSATLTKTDVTPAS